ncbi:MAG: nitroreductase/quinone reductase family protein [Chloroflexota bacterium]|nr:nitroreductase/quinone reductase family protein [Chloroflexota bacterium]
MTDNVRISPPQPIPYPKNRIIKKFYRTPILLYRLGLEKLYGKYILILSTFGRKSGKIHRTPVEYFRDGGRIFIMSGFGDTPDWYQNLQKDPHVTLNTGGTVQHMRSRKPGIQSEWEGVFNFLKTSPVSILSSPGLVNQLDDPQFQEEIKHWPVLTFDSTQEPCPKPLEPDLTWAWPLILLISARAVLRCWLRHRKR